MRTRSRWVIAGFAAIVVVAGAAGVRRETAPHVPVPDALRGDLTARVIRSLEQDPAWRSHTTEDPGWQPVCDGYVFGLDPVDAHDVAHVRTIYAWAHCRWLPPKGQRAGRAAVDLPSEATPVAVRLGAPDRCDAPRDGEDHYTADIDRIFPRDLRREAIHPTSALDAATTRVDVRVNALLT